MSAVVSETLELKDLSFTMVRSERRRTVGITIDRDGELILRVPARCPVEVIERVAWEKRFWIYTKLAAKGRMFRKQGEKEFVNGEGFFYLGRSYRLRLLSGTDEKEDVLRLHHGYFMLKREEQQCGSEHFVRWYTEHGQVWLARRVDLYVARTGVRPQAVRVGDLGYTWGSCGQTGVVQFHWRTMLLPPRFIDYIVVHELVHLREPNHGAAFWRRLEQAMPDFAVRKQWLAENGGRY